MAVKKTTKKKATKKTTAKKATKKKASKKTTAKKATKKKATKKTTAKKATKKKATKKTTAKKATKRKVYKKKKTVTHHKDSSKVVDGPQIETDINSVRHWIAHVEGHSPDWDGLTNKMVKKLNAKDLEPYFAPLRFAGWSSLDSSWNRRFSTKKKDFSNCYIFTGDDVKIAGEIVQWGFQEFKRYLARKKQHGRNPKFKQL